MLERLQGIVIEVVIGDVCYNRKPVKKLQAETQADLLAQAKAYVSRHHTKDHNPNSWELRVRK